MRELVSGLIGRDDTGLLYEVPPILGIAPQRDKERLIVSVWVPQRKCYQEDTHIYLGSSIARSSIGFSIPGNEPISLAVISALSVPNDSLVSAR